MFNFLKVAQWKPKSSTPATFTPPVKNPFVNPGLQNALGSIKLHGAITKKEAPDFTNYIVKPGDNLSHISKNNNVSLEQLRQFNTFKNENVINAGDSIKIPTAQGLKTKGSAGNAPLFPNQPEQRINWQDSVNTQSSADVVNSYERKTGKRPYIVANIDKGEGYVIDPATKDTTMRFPFLAGTGNNNKYYGNSSSSLKNDDKFPEGNFGRNNNLTGEGAYTLGNINPQHAGSAYGKFTVPLRDQRGKEPGLLFHQATSPDRMVKLNKIKELQAQGKPVPPDLVCGSNGCMNVEPKTMDNLAKTFGNNFAGVNTYVLPRESNKNSAIKMKDGFPTLERVGNNFTNTSDTTKAPIDMNTFSRKGPKIDVTRKPGPQTVQAGMSGNNLSEKDKNTDFFFKGMNAASDSLQTHYGLGNDEMAKIKGTTAGIADAETKMGTDYGRYGGLINKKDAHEQKGLMGLFGINNQTLSGVQAWKRNRGVFGMMQDVVTGDWRGQLALNTAKAAPSHGITQMKFMPKNEKATNYLKNQFNITKPEDGYDPYNAGAMSLAAMAENYTNLKANRKKAVTNFNNKVPLTAGWDRIVSSKDYTRNDFDYLPYTWQNPMELNKGTATPRSNNYVKKVKDYQKNNVGYTERQDKRN